MTLQEKCLLKTFFRILQRSWVNKAFATMFEKPPKCRIWIFTPKVPKIITVHCNFDFSAKIQTFRLTELYNERFLVNLQILWSAFENIYRENLWKSMNWEKLMLYGNECEVGKKVALCLNLRGHMVYNRCEMGSSS